MKNIPGCGRGGVGFDENAAKPVLYDQLMRATGDCVNGQQFPQSSLRIVYRNNGVFAGQQDSGGRGMDVRNQALPVSYRGMDMEFRWGKHAMISVPRMSMDKVL
jgi:hypothetical protein